MLHRIDLKCERFSTRVLVFIHSRLEVITVGITRPCLDKCMAIPSVTSVGIVMLLGMEMFSPQPAHIEYSAMLSVYGNVFAPTCPQWSVEYKGRIPEITLKKPQITSNPLKRGMSEAI